MRLIIGKQNFGTKVYLSAISYMNTWRDKNLYVWSQVLAVIVQEEQDSIKMFSCYTITYRWKSKIVFAKQILYNSGYIHKCRKHIKFKTASV